MKKKRKPDLGNRDGMILGPDGFADQMRQLADGGYDPEGFHTNADNLLCSLLKNLGYTEGIKIFEMHTKWYA